MDLLRKRCKSSAALVSSTSFESHEKTQKLRKIFCSFTDAPARELVSEGTRQGRIDVDGQERNTIAPRSNASETILPSHSAFQFTYLPQIHWRAVSRDAHKLLRKTEQQRQRKKKKEETRRAVSGKAANKVVLIPSWRKYSVVADERCGCIEGVTNVQFAGSDLNLARS